MFESVRKKRKNPVINIFGWFLLSVVCVVFIFIGFSPNSSFLSSGGTAAEVNGKAISLRDFKELLDRLESRSGDPSRGNSREARRRMQQNAINILINESLITQGTDELNIFVGDNEVARSLLDIEAFTEEGVFSRLRYKMTLDRIRLTESEFEDKIRHDLLIQKMRDLIDFASRDTDFIDEFDKKINQAQINVSYVLLDPEKVKISSKEVQTFLKDNRTEVKEYYDSHKTEFTVSERVRARHILIKFGDGKKESLDKALKEINEIAAKTQLDNFSEMAKKHSQDPGSRDKGGDLGFFGRGRMLPEFERVAFSTPVGKVTKPVKTKYGYHILLVDEKKKASVKKLDEVKNQIALKLQSRNQYDELLERIRVYLENKNFKDLEIFLGDRNLKWSDTGYFQITSNSIPGIGPHESLLDKAMDLSPERQYARNLVYKGDKAYLLRLKGTKMNKTAGTEDNQMDFFKQLMKQQNTNLMLQQWTDSLRTKASVKINSKLIR